MEEKLNFISFTQKELADLLHLSRQGDSKSFETLSGLIREIAISYFLSKYRLGRISNKDDIEDLANNVYLSFAEQYEKIENLEFWLRRVLFLSFINWYKKSKVHQMAEFDETIYKQNNFIESENSLDAEKIVVVLNTLSEEKQQVVKMRFWKGFKFSEIAKSLNKTEDAVKKIFYRTIEELKEKF
jgi:RNA polymerase sigma factor (sigma-70 family)